MAPKLTKKKIDVKEKDAKKRAKKLREIVDEVLKETDPDPYPNPKNQKERDANQKQKRKRNWIAWHLMYIMWHESARATTRDQGGGGPARGLMQFEPATVKDLLKQYVLQPNRRKATIQNLADAAGVAYEEMEKALDAFVANQAGNAWPAGAPENRIEKWLRESDTFAIKLMRYQFKREGAHRFPGDPNYNGDPQGAGAKEAHAEGWAKWWKRKFDTNEDRKKKKDQFKKNAEHLDKAVAAKDGSKGFKSKFFFALWAVIGFFAPRLARRVTRRREERHTFDSETTTVESESDVKERDI